MEVVAYSRPREVVPPGATPEAAFQALWDEYRSPIWNYLFRFTRDPNDADGWTQDTYLKVWGALPEMLARPDTSWQAWVYRVAQNVARDSLRRGRSVRFLSIERAAPSLDEQGAWLAGGGQDSWGARRFRTPYVHTPRDATPEDAVECAEAGAVVRAALAKLPATWREVLVLREWWGLEYDEIGARRGMTRPAVKSMLYRARNTFHRMATGGAHPDLAAIVASYFPRVLPSAPAAGGAKAPRRADARAETPPRPAGKAGSEARELRELRRALGLKKKDVAALAGLPRATLYNVEHGASAHPHTLAKVRRALKVLRARAARRAGVPA